MYTKKIIVGIGLVLVFVLGYFIASSMDLRQNPPQEQPKETVVSPERFIDESSGTGMSPAELNTALSQLSGDDFDARYMAYITLLQANITGMNRVATERAKHPAIKEQATADLVTNQQELTDLYTLHKLTGYTH